MPDLRQINASIIDPAMAFLPAKFDSVKARVMLLAIGLQESRFEHRRQIGGPARGFWQFERGGGVRGVCTHEATRDNARRICRQRGINSLAATTTIYNALEHDDLLACGFARLLLWSDPAPLPDIGDTDAAWGLYLRTWRPGKPHRHTFDGLYDKAASVFESTL